MINKGKEFALELNTWANNKEKRGQYHKVMNSLEGVDKVLFKQGFDDNIEVEYKY